MTAMRSTLIECYAFFTIIMGYMYKSKGDVINNLHTASVCCG